jgi:hypothetical protein
LANHGLRDAVHTAHFDAVIVLQGIGNRLVRWDVPRDRFRVHVMRNAHGDAGELDDLAGKEKNRS